MPSRVPHAPSSSSSFLVTTPELRHGRRGHELPVVRQQRVVVVRSNRRWALLTTRVAASGVVVDSARSVVVRCYGGRDDVYEPRQRARRLLLERRPLTFSFLLVT